MLLFLTKKGVQPELFPIERLFYIFSIDPDFQYIKSGSAVKLVTSI